jgi:hypothetical protein
MTAFVTGSAKRLDKRCVGLEVKLGANSELCTQHASARSDASPRRET